MVGRVNWVAETYLVFLDIANFVFLPESDGSSIWPSEALEATWGHLRSALLHFFRHEGNADPSTKGVRSQAEVHLRSYAQYIEALFGPKFCTYNLHLLVCGLSYQVRGSRKGGREGWRAIGKGRGGRGEEGEYASGGL